MAPFFFRRFLWLYPKLFFLLVGYIQLPETTGTLSTHGIFSCDKEIDPYAKNNKGSVKDSSPLKPCHAPIILTNTLKNEITANVILCIPANCELCVNVNNGELDLIEPILGGIASYYLNKYMSSIV